MLVWRIDIQYVDSYIAVLLKQLNRSRSCRESAEGQLVLVFLQVSPHISVLHALCQLLILFQKNSSRNTIRVSNSLNQDQALHFVQSDLGPNCLRRLSADDTSR